jgi:branched-subunit amino acid ABC-type transport system permease component
MLLPFIVVGLTTGAVYGLAGVGLVLTYKTSGLFNFAFGAFGTVAAYAFYTLDVEHGVAWPLAAVMSIVLVGVVGGVLFERLAKALADASLALQVASTVGVLLAVEALASIFYGTTQDRDVPEYLPQHIFKIFGTNVTADRLLVAGFALVATGAIYAFFRLARSGTSMRAVVDNWALLDLSGTNPTSARRLAWIMGSMFAAAAGILLAPYVSLTGVTLTLLVIQAFGAAAIGGFSSLPWTFAGGLLIGLVSSIATKYLTTGVLSAVPVSLPFIVLFVVLLVFPKSRIGVQPPVIPRLQSAWRAPPRAQLCGGVLTLVFLLLVPSFAGFYLTSWTEALSYVILFLSLGLLVRTSGQVSLCQIAFVAIGATAFSHFAVSFHIPWLFALLLAGLVAVPIGAVLAIPAIRLTGLYLALATFGFGFVMADMFYSSNWMFGSDLLGLVDPRPDVSWLNLSSDQHFYYLVLAIAVIATVLVMALTRSRLGRLLRAMSDSPTALMSSGAAINVTRVLVFCISAFLAAVAGALQGMALVRVTGSSYDPFLSLTCFVLIVVVVGREPWYALIAGFALALVPSYLTGANVPFYLQLLFGSAAILYALTPEAWREVPFGVRRFVESVFRSESTPRLPISEPDSTVISDAVETVS